MLTTILSIFVITGIFDGKPAEMAFLLIFNWLCLVVSFLLLMFCEMKEYVE